MSLILASTSPRRRRFLEEAGISFKAISPKYDEEHLRISAPEIYVMQLAYQKAMSVKKDFPDDVVLALDTIVVRDEDILGKPKDRADAEAMLRTLRGRWHRVVSAYCTLGKEKYLDYDTTEVYFSDFSEEALKDYLDKNTYLDKAGAYGIQDIVEFDIDVRGSLDTVIGMPMEQVVFHLKGERCDIR